MNTQFMDRTAYRMLYDSILDFKATAALVESDIRRRGVKSKSTELVPDESGRTHHDMWVSMKTVSHFNLGIALELMLKLLVLLNGKTIPSHHGLAKLHDDIPEKYQRQLEDVFQECVRVLPNGFSSIAFLNSDSPKPVRSSLADRDMTTLREFLEYFDQDVLLYLKRYSYELIEKQKWRHYLSDISAFVELINHVMRDVPRY